MAWDGEERRMQERDRDLLTKIDSNLSNFMVRYQDHIDHFNKHISDDKENFNELKKNQDIMREGQDKTRWVIAIGIGIVLCVEFFKNKIFP